MVTDPRVTATHLHGPKLADWLEAEGLITEDFTPEYLSKSRRDAFNRWKKGRAADLGYVDRLLTELHRHIEELPDDVFLETSPNEVPLEKRARITKLKELGWTFREIAAMVGVNRETARYYARKAGTA